MSYLGVAGDLGAADSIGITGETEETRLSQSLGLHPHLVP